MHCLNQKRLSRSTPISQTCDPKQPSLVLQLLFQTQLCSKKTLPEVLIVITRVLGKMTHGKLPPGKLAPRKIVPQKMKLPSMKFFCEFFHIPNFYFCEYFCLKMKNEKSIFVQLIFLLKITICLFYVFHFFSCAYIFDFQAWHTMFVIHICVTNNAGHRYLANEANCGKASITLQVSHNTSIQI